MASPSNPALISLPRGKNRIQNGLDMVNWGQITGSGNQHRFVASVSNPAIISPLRGKKQNSKWAEVNSGQIVQGGYSNIGPVASLQYKTVRTVSLNGLM